MSDADVLEQVRERLEIESFFDYQDEAAEVWTNQQRRHKRLALYYRTGAGKTITALMLMALERQSIVTVIAPPSTHPAWEKTGAALGIELELVSHQKFRQPGYLIPRERAVVVDEFHLLGGHTGKGWKKMDRLARGLKAPIVLASATPNYNDAERVYCIEHVLAPERVQGGFIEFLYRHCETQANPFGMTPIVTQFRNYPDAEAYLAALPEVVHVPDNVFVDIEQVHIDSWLPELFESHGIDTVRQRIIASQMEARHRQAYYLVVDEDGVVRDRTIAAIEAIVDTSQTPVLAFCMSSTIACALHDTLVERDAEVAVITGKDTTVRKNSVLERFRQGDLPLLIGTATLATGTDGLDKVCDTLIIVNDTDDDSLRKQLIGRILPRGEDVDASNKRVVRLNHVAV